MKKFLIIFFLPIILFFACATQKSQVKVKSEVPKADFDIYFREGITFLSQGDYEKAVRSFKNALIINPSSPRVHNLLGISYFQLKDYKNAEKQFNETISLDSSYAQAYSNLGSLYFITKKFDETDVKKKQFRFLLSSFLLIIPSGLCFYIKIDLKKVTLTFQKEYRLTLII